MHLWPWNSIANRILLRWRFAESLVNWNGTIQTLEHLQTNKQTDTETDADEISTASLRGGNKMTVFNIICIVPWMAKVTILPAPSMAHRAAPVSGPRPHVCWMQWKLQYRGLVHWYSYACSTSFLHSWMPSVWQEGTTYHFKSLWYDSAGVRTRDLPIVRRTL